MSDSLQRSQCRLIRSINAKVLIFARSLQSERIKLAHIIRVRSGLIDIHCRKFNYDTRNLSISVAVLTVDYNLFGDMVLQTELSDVGRIGNFFDGSL